jgi:hypothetical protein
LFSAETADCGNNATSTSRIKAVEFHFSGGNPVVDARIDVSDVAGGGFRPQVAYSPGLNQYLIAWEDRRNAGGSSYRFDVYAQRLDGTLNPVGGDMVLAAGSDYTNDNTSAAWTPRPAVAGGNTKFLTSWFDRTPSGGAVVWSVKGSLVPGNGGPGAVFPVAEMTFAERHESAPTGFLSISFNSGMNEFLVGLTSHLESIRGYFSSARVQRVDQSGQLLRLNGSVRSGPGVGDALDASLDGQISVGVASNLQRRAYQIVYAKHAPRQHSQDFDIWGVQVQGTPCPSCRRWLPIICRHGLCTRPR